MSEELLGEDTDLEQNLEMMNKLTSLGNQAISLGLIIGHGYCQGKYEILHRGKALILSEEEGQVYLEKLIGNYS